MQFKFPNRTKPERGHRYFDKDQLRNGRMFIFCFGCVNISPGTTKSFFTKPKWRKQGSSICPFEYLNGLI